MPVMTPPQVVRDPAALQRFQAEVAYRDDRPRDPSVVGYDADVLSSPSGLVAVAWLWPDQTFAPDADPFELAATTSPARWCARLGAQVEHAMLAAARAVSAHGEHDSVDDILRYLMWQAGLSEGDIVRLREGTADQLAVWVRVCRCLHLEFHDGWRISDPARLAGRIDQALWASQIADHLKGLPAGKLRDLWRKLPPQVTDAVPRVPREVYNAPKGRYRGLYLALAADRSPSPTYTIDDINKILTLHGESPLPPSATVDTSWWAGRGTKTEGRPQVAAWWAAGYRIAEDSHSLAVNRDNLILLHLRSEEGGMTDEERGRLEAITSVTFEGLPGREDWLDDEERFDVGEYRMPGDVSVPVPPLSAPPLLSDHVDEVLLAHQLPLDVINWAPEPEPKLDAGGGPAPDEPAEEAALVTLVQLLEAAGEMDREQIARGLPVGDDNPSGTHGPDSAGSDLDRSREVKRLLTKARRRGLIINRGTNRKPRWVTVGSKGDLVLRIKQILDERRSSSEQPTIEVLRIGPDDAVPAGFLAQVATRLGVGAPPHAPDLQLARAIVESAGADWQEDLYASEDGLLTREGLGAVSDATLSAM